MEYTKLFITKQDGIGIITLNNPQVLNALTDEQIAEMEAAFKEINADPEIRVAIITGSGKAFIAGADIKGMSKMVPEDALELAARTTSMHEQIIHSRKPWIAAINGYALGGGLELALCCDIRIASEKAKLGLPETGLGIFPGGGGTQYLPRLVGAGKAKELIFTGDKIDAAEALRINLVNKVVPAEELMDAAMEMAKKIAKNSSMGIAYARDAIDEGYEIGLDAGLRYEIRMFSLCFATEDQKEGMAAFIEKRDANFPGR